VVTAAKEAGKAIPKILEIEMDVKDESSISAAAIKVESEFGKLDILYNNAGYLSQFLPIMSSIPDEYWNNYEINIKGTYLVTRAFLPLILKGGEKTIVNLTSRGAHGLMSGGSGYQTTKMAVCRFTEYVCVEYGDEGV
jgi:NADP-dependent 3-hydroxy acid dehydrogenase YdfG